MHYEAQWVSNVGLDGHTIAHRECIVSSGNRWSKSIILTIGGQSKAEIPREIIRREPMRKAF